MLNARTTLNCGGKLLDLSRPRVMGILNVTPDSFFEGGKYQKEKALLEKTAQMQEEGASIIDVGGMSSRPGAAIIGEEEELRRVIPAVIAIRKHFPDVIVSVDTIHAKVARESVEAGAGMINDISAGRLDPDMYRAAAALKAPYVLMHMQGTPGNMQVNPQYQRVTEEILDFFILEIGKLRAAGVEDIILDVGFGFGKSVEHNFQLLKQLHAFKILGWPVLTGLSRKSMICKVIERPPQAALNGTTALHMVALQQGSNILRVHDVREAVEVIKLWRQLESVEVSP